MLPQNLVDAGFQLSNPESLTSRFFHPIFGEIDLETLAIEDAERLVKSGFPGLIYIEPNTASIQVVKAVEIPLLVVNDLATDNKKEVEEKPTQKRNK